MNAFSQSLIPQHLLSRMAGYLANARLGGLTTLAIKKFINHYQVNMSEAKIDDYRLFTSFNDFFTRELKENARMIDAGQDSLISPADGCVSECGYLDKASLLQAKGAYFNVNDLCGSQEVGSIFEDGAFLTAYLSPKDYHRFHMPITGRLTQMIYVPGKLFSVNQASVNNVSNLFARNERVICIFDTEIGKVALIAVGAMIVGSIGMNWCGIVAPGKEGMKSWDYRDYPVALSKGQEVGHFRLGSTVIILTEKDAISWDQSMQPEKKLLMGQKIGSFC